MFKRISLVALFAALLVTAGCEGGGTYQPVTKFDPARNPAQDLTDAVTEAQPTGKRILLDVGGEWCIWCHRLDKFIESHEGLATFVDEHYIVLKINYSPENKNEEFLSQYPEVPGYPHFFVLESDGSFLHSQGTAELEDGGKSYSEEALMDFFKAWSK